MIMKISVFFIKSFYYFKNHFNILASLERHFTVYDLDRNKITVPCLNLKLYTNI